MKILLTGSEGFVGSHVYDALVYEGHEVTGLDCLEERVHGRDYKPTRTQLNMPVGLVPYSILREADILIHLAAQVSVADSMTDPFRYLHHNTIQTYELLTQIRLVNANGHGPRKVIVASSSSVYGNVAMPFREDGPTHPTNIYGLTKLDQEQATLLWCKMLGIDAVALRFFNIYGPGQSMRNKMTGVMANFAREIMAGRRPQLTEDGKQLRDFIHVYDIADAIVRVATEHTPDPIYNLCTGEGTELYEATALLARALGTSIDPEITGTTRHGDQRNVVGTNALFRAQFPGWHPRSYMVGVHDFAQAIR